MTLDELKVRLAIGVFSSIGGAFWALDTVLRLRKKKKIQDLSLVPVVRATRGLFEMQGFAWPQKAFLNLEGKLVSYVEFKLMEVRNSGRSRYLKLILSGSSGNFVFSDETGSSLVDMSQIDFNCEEKKYSWSSLSSRSQEIFLNWIKDKLLACPGFAFPPKKDFFSNIFSRGYVIFTKEISIGSPVYVIGNFFSEKKETKVLKGHSRFFDEYSKYKKEMLSSLKPRDLNFDRIISEEEFAKAFNKVAEDTLEKDGQIDLSSIESLTLKGQFKGLPESKLIVANTHEEYFFRKISAYNSLSMFGSICLLYFGFYVLFVTIQLKFFSQ